MGGLHIDHTQREDPIAADLRLGIEDLERAGHSPDPRSDTRFGPTADQAGGEQVEGETRDEVRMVSEP